MASVDGSEMHTNWDEFKNCWWFVNEIGGIKVVWEVEGLGEGDEAADLVELGEGRETLELEDEDFRQFD